MDLMRISLCSLASYGAGRLASRCRLPAITGMMMAGVVLGPEALGLLTPGSISRAAPLEQACLALIAMAAGLELTGEDLARSGRQVAWCTLGISAGSWLAAGAAVAALITLQGAESLGLPPGAAGAAASLCATLALARSPASAVRGAERGGGGLHGRGNTRRDLGFLTSALGAACMPGPGLRSARAWRPAARHRRVPMGVAGACKRAKSGARRRFCRWR